MLTELRTNIAGDMARFQKAVEGVETQVTQLEATHSMHDTRINVVEQGLEELKWQQQQTDDEIDALEDHTRWYNLKIQGILESVTMDDSS
ncbi:Hypothetical predicted protein [Pelobates cultripes]|uniref:Uncharacterized protein n=1 Tax=Pelobates cultripes TaxID=61616 RepID=A0AAD1THW1_PELCU|nr:Hypothetical predicted protein [Pelobates cultripes]